MYNIIMKGSSLTYCARVALVRQSRRLIHMGRVVPEVDEELGEKVITKEVNPKKIITRRNMGMVFLPARLQAIAEDRLRKYSDREFRQEAKYLIEVMTNLKLPDDRHSLKIKKADIKTVLELREKTPLGANHDPSEFVLAEEEQSARSKLSYIISGTLAEQRRDWHYYEYDQRAAHLYLAARLAPNYSCIKTVMKEIRDLDPDFVPNSILDFGSGPGTAYWAANENWPKQISEFMNIDISEEQKYLSECLLREGSDMGETPPGIFHRQYLPVSEKVKYNMVIAAFSMLELPTRELRANVIENLWRKTNDILVIIERGNRGGFAVINEARNFVLDLGGHNVTKKVILTDESRPIFKHAIPNCHVMAPCSHEFACPKMDLPTKRNSDICRFRVSYMPLEFGEKKTSYMHEDFSYVVLRKKPHQTYINRQCPLRWPRIVEKRQKSGGQVTHKLCCPNGAIATATITKGKHGKAAYELAKACDWGDILPVKVCDTYVVKNSRLIGDK